MERELNLFSSENEEGIDVTSAHGREGQRETVGPLTMTPYDNQQSPRLVVAPLLYWKCATSIFWPCSSLLLLEIASE